MSAAVDEMVTGAAQWFGSLGRWPNESVRQVAVQNIRAKALDPGAYDNPAYYGIAGVLLMLLAANDGLWPPMSPSAFAKSLSRPNVAEQLVRYIENVKIVEEEMNQ